MKSETSARPSTRVKRENDFTQPQSATAATGYETKAKILNDPGKYSAMYPWMVTIGGNTPENGPELFWISVAV
jgi:hypothetical protein